MRKIHGWKPHWNNPRGQGRCGVGKKTFSNHRIQGRSFALGRISARRHSGNCNPSWWTLAGDNRFQAYLDRPLCLPSIRKAGLQAGISATNLTCFKQDDARRQRGSFLLPCGLDRCQKEHPSARQSQKPKGVTTKLFRGSFPSLKAEETRKSWARKFQ